MRISAQLFCLAASLASAPAFAQVGKDGGPASAAPQSLSGQALSGQATPAQQPSPKLNFGFNKSAEERPLLPLAPIEKDQLELSWKPGGKWGITLDLTSRSDNQVLPREEMTAGAYYQVTPRFRFGGGVTVKGDSLSSSLSNPGANFNKDVSEATVRVESAFSF
jgi:hypothetical protein